MSRYVGLSERAGAGATTPPGADGLRDVTHLIWPESAFPFFLTREPDALAAIANMLPPDTVLITGAASLAEPAPGRSGLRAYNSVYVIDHNGHDSRELRQAASRAVRRIPAVSGFPRTPRADAAHQDCRADFCAGERRRRIAVPPAPPMSCR